VEDSNRYYYQYLDSLEDRPSSLPDVTDSEMFLFLGIIIQMGHIRDKEITEQLLSNFSHLSTGTL
jgi:hypothetical protein